MIHREEKMKIYRNDSILSVCFGVRTAGCHFCKQWRFKDDRGVFINKSLCLKRQVFVKFAKRSAVFIVTVEMILVTFSPYFTFTPPYFLYDYLIPLVQGHMAIHAALS